MTSDSDLIRHIVLLILENHSFDQMLGCFKELYPELEGIALAKPYTNKDTDGRIYEQTPMHVRQMLKWDPHHEVEHVKVQLENHNSGFVRDFSNAYPDSTPEARKLIMGYYPLGFLPALHALGKDFRICDHWFSSLPGPTWPNRFFALTGTSNGRVSMPDDGTHKADLPGYFQQTQDTVFDRLNEQAIHWKVYFHDIPQTTVLVNQRQPHNTARYFYIDHFYKDARGPEEKFPQFCLIEPDYMGRQQNDGHPPHDIMKTEKLIADVYNSIRANDALWKSTLLVVVYDEHGGFFDHVEPPAAVPPDDHREEKYDFNRFGVRVPAVLVSPWVERGVEATQFDHTSLLKYLIDKWNLKPLGQRTASATSIACAIQGKLARGDTISRIELTKDQLLPPNPELEEAAFGQITVHQAALQQLSVYLEEEAFEEIPMVTSWAARMFEGFFKVSAWMLDRLYGEPTFLKASIAKPDMLGQAKNVNPSDRVARFIMRKKRYAAMGIATRLRDPSVSSSQKDHSLQTLALISDRPFQNEGTERAKNADEWLKYHNI